LPDRRTARRAAVALALVALAAGPAPAAAQPGTEHGLVALSLTPQEVRRPIGDVQFYTAQGRFADGTIRNVTQRVEYRSSDPKVAVARNEKGRKSAVELVGVGRATISAVDPLTGVTSTDGNGDASVNVVGRLERLSIAPARATKSVGETMHFTVTGHYPGGATRNLTQQAHYMSSDPSVALMPNRKGEKSLLQALAPGTATITARDATSGATTAVGATITIVGKLERLTLAPPRPRRAPGQVQNYTATGHYGGGATRNLTQQVEYASSDPAVARAPNAEGSRSRIEAVAPGIATITARHPESGIATGADGAARLIVYDPVTKKAPGEDALRKRAAAPEVPPAPAAPAVVCGDAGGDGALGLSDPFWIALGATGLTACAPAACDVNADGAVTLGDAVTVFLVVAGYAQPLNCP